MYNTFTMIATIPVSICLEQKQGTFSSGDLYIVELIKIHHILPFPGGEETDLASINMPKIRALASNIHFLPVTFDSQKQ